MSTRRNFLKGSAALAAAVAVGRAGRVFAAGGCPVGIIYTKQNPGMWAGKEGSHAPRVSIQGKKVTIQTKHPMSDRHYIVRHTLVSPDGKVLGTKTFYPTDKKAVSTHELPADAGGKFYATSFCNIHDFWVTEFSV